MNNGIDFHIKAVVCRELEAKRRLHAETFLALAVEQSLASRRVKDSNPDYRLHMALGRHYEEMAAAVIECADEYATWAADYETAVAS